MLKIVDIHPSATVNGEYVVLQNLGLTTVSLRGWILATEGYISEDAGARMEGMYVFLDDVQIRPYARVVLFTGCGDNGWYPTTDGKPAYVAFWGRTDRVWSTATRLILLQPISSRRIGIPADVTPPVHA